MGASLMVRRGVACAAVATTLLGSGAFVTGGTDPRPDAPFVALAAGHCGVEYSDQVADVFGDVNSRLVWDQFHIVEGHLAPGLSLDPLTGEIKGTPNHPGVYDFRIEARGFLRRPFPIVAETRAFAAFARPVFAEATALAALARPGIGFGVSSAVAQVRASVAVFSQDEREIVAGQSFQGMGPYGTSVRTTTFNWTSSFDGKTRPATVVIYTPESTIRPFPFPPIFALPAHPTPPPPWAASGVRSAAHPELIDRDASCTPPTMPTPAAASAAPSAPVAPSTQIRTLSAQVSTTLAPTAVAPTSFAARSLVASSAAQAVRSAFWPHPTWKGFPLIVHHRGRGFSHTDYNDLLERIASYGIVIASVSDSESFYNPSEPGLADWQYDGARAELGMESASAAQEATMEFVLGLAATPGDALYGRIDADNVFFEGHSRGGGATHASHVRSIPLRVKGVIYFMAYDLRNFSNCAPPGVAPAYEIPTAQKRLPSLVIAAEKDGDLVYPIADQFIDRATGPTTFVTVYGGNHDNLGDTNSYDSWSATISRHDEQVRVAEFVVAFVKRWAEDDISLEGFLYGGEHATSTTVGVASWHRTSPTLMVDDFQGSDPAHNQLGGDDLATGLNRSVASIYPATGDMPSLGLKHSILTPSAQDSSFALTLGPAGASHCLRDYRALAMRIEQTGSQGWNMGLWARLTDACGRTASVKFAKEDGTSTGYLPAWQQGGPNLSRFVTLTIPLARLQQSNPCLDLGEVTKVEVVLHTPSSTPDPSQKIVVDDVRFE
jgi:hypothetical protein